MDLDNAQLAQRLDNQAKDNNKGRDGGHKDDKKNGGGKGSSAAGGNLSAGAV